MIKRRLFLLELNRLSRLPHFRWRRSFIIALLVYLPMFNIHETTTLGLKLVTHCSWLICIMMILLAPFSCSQVISEKRNKQNHELLYLAGIKPTTIIAMRIYSKCALMMLYVAGVVPLFFMAISFGGVSWLQILSITIAITTTILFSCALGVFCYLYYGVNSSTSAFINIIVFAILLFCEMFTTFSISSCGSLHFFLQIGVSASDFSGIFFQLFFLVLLFTFCWLRLPKRAEAILNPEIMQTSTLTPQEIIAKYDQFPKNDAIKSKEHHEEDDDDDDEIPEATAYETLEMDKRLYRKHKLFTNPMCWKDFHFLHQYSRAFSDMPRHPFAFIGNLIVMFAFSWLFTFFTIVNIFFASFLPFANEKRALETVFLTSMSNKDIVFGKLFALLYGMRWKIFCDFTFVMASLCTFAFIHDELTPWTFSLISLYMVSIFAFVVMSNMLSSFRIKTKFLAFVSSIVFMACIQYMIAPIWWGTLYYPLALLALSFLLYLYMVENVRNIKFTHFHEL